MQHVTIWSTLRPPRDVTQRCNSIHSPCKDCDSIQPGTNDHALHVTYILGSFYRVAHIWRKYMHRVLNYCLKIYIDNSLTCYIRLWKWHEMVSMVTNRWWRDWWWYWRRLIKLSLYQYSGAVGVKPVNCRPLQIIALLPFTVLGQRSYVQTSIQVKRVHSMIRINVKTWDGVKFGEHKCKYKMDLFQSGAK